MKTKFPRPIRSDGVVIFNYGVPRSGTTLVLYTIQQGGGFLTTRISEGAVLHPRHDPSGFLFLAQAFIYHTLVFVRTTRHPVDVLNSLAVVYPSLVKDINEFRYEVEQYRLESEGSATAQELVRMYQDIQQKHVFISRKKPIVFATIKYEDLGNPEVRDSFLKTIADQTPFPQENFYIWRFYLEEVWKVDPVREGRLSTGKMQQMLSSKQLQYIRERLGGIIDKEGLVGTSQLVDW